MMISIGSRFDSGAVAADASKARIGGGWVRSEEALRAFAPTP
jgi:hypothetical protein